MKSEMGELVTSLNTNVSDNKVTGLLTLEIRRNGKVSMRYTDHIETHPAIVIGYLTALCCELSSLIEI